VSKREQVISAVETLIKAALPAADVQRNVDKPERPDANGVVIIRDGDPGQPEYSLSPLIYLYTHRIPVEVLAYESPGVSREQALDTMLGSIGVAVAADPTLGGLCDYVEPDAPAPDDLETEGAVSGRWAEIGVIAVYGTSNPLT
jgi:hypothetical protein